MRKYGTTWAVFVLLLVLVVFIFSLTSINKREEPITYSGLLKMVQNQPSDITEVTMINNEPIIMVKLKGDPKDKQVIVPTEAKADLIKEINKVGISLKTSPPDKIGVLVWRYELAVIAGHHSCWFIASIQKRTVWWKSGNELWSRSRQTNDGQQSKS